MPSQLVPSDPDFFQIDGDRPVLLGSRCGSCEERFFPRRWQCPICLDDVDDVELTTEGILYSYTYVHVPMFGKQRRDAAGYGVGQVDLDDGVRIQTVITGDPETWHIGERFAAQLEVLDGVAADADKPQKAIYRFAPVGAPTG